MFDKYMVMSRGFQNVTDAGRTIGFQMLVRITYYRGVFLPLVTRFDVAVDGEKFGPEAIRFGLSGKIYTMDELGNAERVHWDFGVPAILTILKLGGLNPGIHDVEIVQQVKPSYMGENGFIGRIHKKMTLVA